MDYSYERAASKIMNLLSSKLFKSSKHKKYYALEFNFKHLFSAADDAFSIIHLFDSIQLLAIMDFGFENTQLDLDFGSRRSDSFCQNEAHEKVLRSPIHRSIHLSKNFHSILLSH